MVAAMSCLLQHEVGKIGYYITIHSMRFEFGTDAFTQTHFNIAIHAIETNSIFAKLLKGN